jgi:hypothetical protein
VGYGQDQRTECDSRARWSERGFILRDVDRCTGRRSGGRRDVDQHITKHDGTARHRRASVKPTARVGNGEPALRTARLWTGWRPRRKHNRSRISRLVVTQVSDRDDTLMCDWNQRHSDERADEPHHSRGGGSHQNKLTWWDTSDLLAGLDDGVHGLVHLTQGWGKQCGEQPPLSG